MMNIRTSSSFDQDKVLEIIASFAHSGKTYWEKRNTIKVFETEHGKWNVKSFQVPHLINRFAYKYVRKSKARRSFEHAEILLSKGILTPSPIAYVEYSNTVGLTNSFYVSENLEYDFNFEKVIDPNFPDRENIMRQFAQFTFKLHENRIHHFDHSKGNTLMCKTGEGVYEFYLIDLNRMRFENMSYEMRIDNFNRLSLTEDMIQIIGNEYASLIGKDSNQVTEDIRKSCQKFDDYTVRKSRWKKRIGKS